MKISAVKDEYFPHIQKYCEVRVAQTMFYDIFQIFEEENCPIKNIYHTLALFSKKSEESTAGIVKQPANFINNITRKNLVILRRNIQLYQNSIWRNKTNLLVILAKNQVSQKRYSQILKNMLMLLFSIMVLCQIGMDGYRVKYNLG